MQINDFLEPGFYYHIFNRGNNHEYLFFEEKNYNYFLELYARHIIPIADTYCYCLMKNHFHFLIRIKEDISDKNKKLHQPFSNLFNAYSKSMNKMYIRKGSLFERQFERRKIDNEKYLRAVTVYIHMNPFKHENNKDFNLYEHSSYKSLISNKPTKLKREEVIEWFGDIKNFEYFHKEQFIIKVGLINEIAETDH
ncbi:MAG: transposase [Bacteroidota bacterium]|nr:transposase [Bacteroidota bacterium]